jgi:hypothetical protein
VKTRSFKWQKRIGEARPRGLKAWAPATSVLVGIEDQALADGRVWSGAPASIPDQRTKKGCKGSAVRSLIDGLVPIAGHDCHVGPRTELRSRSLNATLSWRQRQRAMAATLIGGRSINYATFWLGASIALRGNQISYLSPSDS